MTEPATPEPAAILEVTRLHVADTLGPAGGSLGRVVGVDWRCGVGVHGVVGGPADGTAALAGALAGALRPSSGEVRIDGRAPWKTSAVRRAVAALLATPAAAGKTVAEALALATELRGGEGRGDVVAELGLASWSSRRLDALSYPEARAVDLAIALAHPSPRLVVLYEPWSLVAAVPAEALRRAIFAVAASAAVVVVTSALRDVSDLADDVVLLESGRLALGDGGRGWGLRAASRLVVSLEDRGGSATAELVRALAARLPGASALGWERSSEDPGLTTVNLCAQDLDEASRILVEVAAAQGVDILSIEAPPEDARVLLAASFAARHGGPR